MKKNSRLSVWLMAGAFVLCFVTRLLQIVLGTDMTSGFLYHDNGFLLDWGYYGLILITFVLSDSSRKRYFRRKSGGYWFRAAFDGNVRTI